MSLAERVQISVSHPTECQESHQILRVMVVAVYGSPIAKLPRLNELLECRHMWHVTLFCFTDSER